MTDVPVNAAPRRASHPSLTLAQLVALLRLHRSPEARVAERAMLASMGDACDPSYGDFQRLVGMQLARGRWGELSLTLRGVPVANNLIRMIVESCELQPPEPPAPGTTPDDDVAALENRLIEDEQR